VTNLYLGWEADGFKSGGQVKDAFASCAISSLILYLLLILVGNQVSGIVDSFL